MDKKICNPENTLNEIVKILTSFPSSSTVFNQYHDYNNDVDLFDAPSIRVSNLYNYLKSIINRARILIVGEAAGPWGCRFSGIPFTSERQIISPSFPIHGERSSRKDPLINTKVTPPYTSKSAEIFWKIMLPFYDQFIVWDAFPLHPHQYDEILSVRNPTKCEVEQFAEALQLLVDYMRPHKILAVGKIAHQELQMLGLNSIYIRHPSRGGVKLFTSGINEVFKSLTEHNY